MDKKIFNIPNLLTVIRVLSLPVFIYFLFRRETIFHIYALTIFAVASFTDLIDGYLARKWNQETEFGKFLDPLADKIIVIGCFITFIILHEQIEIWMVLLIIARDMLITTLRYIAIKGGSSIRTSMMGKVKTAFQMGAIILILIFFILISTKKRQYINEIYASGHGIGKSGLEIASGQFLQFIDLLNRKNVSWREILYQMGSFVPYFGMLLTTLITVLSGIRYLYTNRHLLKKESLIRVFSKNGN